MLPPVGDDRGALRLRRVEVAGDLVAMLAGHERAHLRRRIRARTDLDVRQPLRDRIDQRVGDVTDGHDGRDRHAPLSGGAVAR